MRVVTDLPNDPRPDTAAMRVLVFKDDKVEFSMLVKGEEVGRVTVDKNALLALLEGEVA